MHTERAGFFGREGHGGKSCADGIFINFLFFANLVEKAAVFSQILLAVNDCEFCHYVLQCARALPRMLGELRYPH